MSQRTMKVIVSTLPLRGHVNPMQPVVLELIRRRHEVVWITGDEYEREVTETGATFLPMFEELVDHTKNCRPDKDKWGFDKTISLLRKYFVDLTDYRVNNFYEDTTFNLFDVDLVLVEFGCGAARIYSELTTIPFATLGIIPLFTPDPMVPPWGSGRLPPTTVFDRWRNTILHSMAAKHVTPKLIEAYNVERQKFHLRGFVPHAPMSVLTRSQDLHLMMSTEAFEFPREKWPRGVRFVGPLLPTCGLSGFTVPPWWNQMVAHPRERVVHVTQGTYQTDANKLIVRTGNIAGTTSATSGGREIGVGQIPFMPANVRHATYIPHPKLLEHVGVMVTNGGANGVITALNFGIPLVCAGQTEDKADVSSRVEWSGAGINLKTETPSQDSIKKAVLKVMHDPKYRQAAEKIRDDFAQHNGPVEAVDELEKLVERKGRHRLEVTEGVEGSTGNACVGEGPGASGP